MRTPLYDEHVSLGAKITDFAGWDMPLYYTSIAEETLAVRSTGGLFDLSHMGEIAFAGPKALDTVQYLTTNDASRLDVGQAQYTLLCNEQGGVLDDLIIYRTAEDAYLAVVNASNASSDFEWIVSHTADGAEVSDESSETAIIAIQGPEAASVISRLAGGNLHDLGRFHIRECLVAGVSCLVARTGYTGEDGFELLCGRDEASALWAGLLDTGRQFGVVPVGLGARDVLRLEAGYPLYGHELSQDTTPVEARLMWVVKPDKGDFVGRDAILAAATDGPTRLLSGLEATERCVPRQGYLVEANGEAVGLITSGTFSPTLQKAIALAYLNAAFANEDQRVEIAIRGRTCGARVVRVPFYRPQRGPVD